MYIVRSTIDHISVKPVPIKASGNSHYLRQRGMGTTQASLPMDRSVFQSDLLQILLRKLALKPKLIERERQLFSSILTITSMRQVSVIIDSYTASIQTDFVAYKSAHILSCRVFLHQESVWLTWGSRSRSHWAVLEVLPRSHLQAWPGSLEGSPSKFIQVDDGIRFPQR